jgi:hypothetical protein
MIKRKESHTNPEEEKLKLVRLSSSKPETKERIRKESKLRSERIVLAPSLGYLSMTELGSGLVAVL